jgi:tetratricopeptide (TPR) repeat protein
VTAWALLALACAGCGSRSLYERYQAERMFWRAQRLERRVELHPSGASPADFALAARAYEAVIRRYPPTTVQAESRLEDAYFRDVAVISGRAAIGIGRLAEAQGHDDDALARYSSARDAYASVPPVRLEASLAYAHALERLDRLPQAVAAWGAIVEICPFVDARTGKPVDGVLDAPLHAAEIATRLEWWGRADSLLADAAGRYRAALEARPRDDLAVALLLRLASAERRRGRPDEAAAALRSVLARRSRTAPPQDVVFTLGELWLGAGQPDSTLVYADWLDAAWHARSGAQALSLRARALEDRNEIAAALQAYQAFLDRYSQLDAACAYALMRRGALFERQGRWELARTEYHTLAVRFPVSQEAMHAMLHVASYYVAARDSAAARSEARASIERLDRLIAEYRDTDVELLARRTRADLELTVADWSAGYRSLCDLWARDQGSAVGEAAAFRAASLAEGPLHDRESALRIYRELAQGAPTENGRSKARASAERLTKGEG